MQAGSNSNPLGIDVSAWNTIVDFTTLKASVRFAFIRATYGTSIQDRKLAQHVQGFKSVGIPIGAYHFAIPAGHTENELTASAKAQADYFLAALQKVGGVQQFELAPVLDIEDNSNHLTPDELQTWIQAWFNAVEAVSQRPSILYTYPAFWQEQMGNRKVFGNHPLWIAAYGVTKPGDIGGWTTWTFWQFSDKVTLPGISGSVDRDECAGSLTLALVTPSPTALKRGDQGLAVKSLQEELNTLGVSPPLAVDGDYGPATEQAVRAFQKAHGLVVDGIAGTQTLSTIHELLVARTQATRSSSSTPEDPGKALGMANAQIKSLQGQC